MILINNFVANTSDFFNTFSESVEKKISNVSNRITELEILLSFMEAKLHSIPGIEDGPALETSTPNINTSVGDTAPFLESTSLDNSVPSPKEKIGVRADEHPDYLQFFKLLKLGVPLSVIQAKIIAANLDPEVINHPDLIL